MRLVVDRLDSFDHITWNVAEPSFQERYDVLLSRLAGILQHDNGEFWTFLQTPLDLAF